MRYMARKREVEIKLGYPPDDKLPDPKTGLPQKEEKPEELWEKICRESEARLALAAEIAAAMAMAAML